MTPFAYHVTVCSWGEIDWEKITPTLRAAVQRIITDCEPDWVSREKIDLRACFADETEVKLDMSLLRAKVDLDMDAIRAEAEAAIAENAREQAKWLKTIKGTVTGSPWLCDMGLDDVVAGMVEQREWRWKTMEEMDWDALEASRV
jgi:hypothetical protein